MTEESDSLFPAGPLPAWLAPVPGKSLPTASPRKKPARELTGAEVIYLMQRRAMDLLDAERFAEALTVFEQFLVMDPEAVNWLFLKGVCLLELGDAGRRSPR